MRKRASHSNNYDNDPTDNGHGADSDPTNDHNALLVNSPSSEEKGHAKACPFLRLFGLLGRRFVALRFFFRSLADHGGDSLKFFAATQIH